MADYKKMYFKMAAQMANAVVVLEATIAMLVKVQQECEDIYVLGEEISSSNGGERPRAQEKE